MKTDGSTPSENQAPTPEKPPKKAHPAVKRRQRIEEYLITHPEATNATVAAYFGVSERTISSVRSVAIRKNLIQPSYFDHTTPPIEPLTTEGAEAIAKELQKMRGLHNEPLSDEEMLSILSGMVRRSAADNNLSLARDAILAYKKIQAATEVRELGPGPPQTEQELIERTSDIIDVVGPTLVAACIMRQLPDFLPLFEEEFGRLKATQPQVAPQGSTQPADSSPPMKEPNGNASSAESE